MVKVGAQKFPAKKGLFSPMGALKRKKTPFFWDLWYFMGSHGAREWQKFLPNPFFIDSNPKRAFLPNFTFLSFLPKKLEPEPKKSNAFTLRRFFFHHYQLFPRNDSGNHLFSIIFNHFFEPQTLFSGCTSLRPWQSPGLRSASEKCLRFKKSG